MNFALLLVPMTASTTQIAAGRRCYSVYVQNHNVNGISRTHRDVAHSSKPATCDKQGLSNAFYLTQPLVQ
jgi:hypothetical protein